MKINIIVWYNKISMELAARSRCQHIPFLRGQRYNKGVIL